MGQGQSAPGGLPGEGGADKKPEARSIDDVCRPHCVCQPAHLEDGLPHLLRSRIGRSYLRRKASAPRPPSLLSTCSLSALIDRPSTCRLRTVAM